MYNLPHFNKSKLISFLDNVNSNKEIIKDLNCLEFSCAFIYHCCNEPILDSYEKVKQSNKVLDKMYNYFISQLMYEDEITFEKIKSLANLTLIQQAKHKRAIPMHATTLIIDENKDKYIIEKDGDSLVSLIALEDWNTYKEDFPVYSAYGSRVYEMFF
ncbi:MAG: hypothetical protein WC867_03235 [Candidatus Pacearchaeota archaeon]|jgi:hypothetical protein